MGKKKKKKKKAKKEEAKKKKRERLRNTWHFKQSTVLLKITETRKVHIFQWNANLRER